MLKGRTVSRQELIEAEKIYLANLFQWQARWTLGLAVGNGAALAAVVGVMIDRINDPVAQLLLPCAWLFALGLIISGAIPTYDLLYLQSHYSAVTEHIAHLDESDMNSVTQENSSKLDWGRWALEWGAALCFASGLLYPLVIVTKRLVLTGSLAG